MKQYLIICRSITHAQRISRLLQRKGVWHQIVRVPMGLIKSGCGYAVKVREQQLSLSLEHLRREHVPYVSVFVDEGNRFREVSV